MKKIKQLFYKSLGWLFYRLDNLFCFLSCKRINWIENLLDELSWQCELMGDYFYLSKDPEIQRLIKEVTMKYENEN
ncbi:hypothetical protein M0R19_05560 [Candidatus Pacearchaeota archaeon]|jgi:hypothetical protein|nr:hypothetical protein [Candidatus Pacearchaeota archaeon]